MEFRVFGVKNEILRFVVGCLGSSLSFEVAHFLARRANTSLAGGVNRRSSVVRETEPRRGDTEICAGPPGLKSLGNLTFRWLTPPAGVVSPLRGWQMCNFKTVARPQAPNDTP